MYRPIIVLRGRHKIKMKLPYSNKDRVFKSPGYLILYGISWMRKLNLLKLVKDLKGN